MGDRPGRAPVLPPDAAPLTKSPAGLRLESYHEGLSSQIMHVGSPSAEAPTIAQLHREFPPERQLVLNGYHQEIYLNDLNRVVPEKLKTVLRQAVRSSAWAGAANLCSQRSPNLATQY